MLHGKYDDGGLLRILHTPPKFRTAEELRKLADLVGGMIHDGNGERFDPQVLRPAFSTSNAPRPPASAALSRPLPRPATDVAWPCPSLRVMCRRR